jgi:predicted CxxxxCH...CXXCH cytochrome family protein
MKKAKQFLWLPILLLTGVLTACGSGGGSSDTAAGASATAVSAGVAVDPYIVGARFEEVSSDGTHILQSSSTASDSRGHFSFTSPVQEESIIRLKSSARGMHGNAPYTGMLKRRVHAGDAQNAVVSPLTTLLANGMSEAEVIALLASAGLSGIEVAELTSDPMKDLYGATGELSNTQLRGLRANMAVNTLLMALNDFDYAGEEQNAVRLVDCVALSVETLNAAGFQALAATISGELGAPFTFDDLAAAAVEVQRTVVAQIRQDLAAGSGSISAERFYQMSSSAAAELPTIARSMCAARLGGTLPGTGAESLFAANCQGCHTLGTGSGTMDLAGDGALLTAKFDNGASHKGQSLSAGELLALATYLDAAVPTEPPPTPLTGSALYSAECQGCHGSLDTTDISARSADSIAAAIAANAGGMGYLTLNAEQIALIADALPAVTTPPEPTPERTGSEVYGQECASCHALGTHDSAGAIDLAAKGSVIVTKIQNGHMGKTLSSSELTALADFADTFGSTPPPVVPRNAETVYNDICAACHMLSGFDATGAIDLAGLGNTAVTKVAAGHGGTVSTVELTGLATWLDTFSPPPPPVEARDGATLYNQNCAACHKLFGYDTDGNIDLASLGNAALNKLATGHGGTVSDEEQQNLAAWLNTWTPAPPPVVDRNGVTVYSENCAGCHKLYGYDASGNVDLASQGSLATTKVAGGHGGSVTSGELVNLTNWLNTFSPAPPPVVARLGQDIYDAECAGCHKVNGFDATGSAPDIAGNGSGATTKLNGGHNGISLIVEEVGNLAGWLNTFQAGDPYAGSCNSCHGQPPDVGAHGVHTALAKVGTDCAVCHSGAGHNGGIDLAFPATWNAKSGTAGGNGSTCSNIRCHGGQTTPDWTVGTLNSSTQCKSCHAYGTGQYNSYTSGEHRRHAVDKNYDCLVCHDAGKLGNGHFGDLSTISFEQSPAATIKSSLSYSSGTCRTAGCHGSESW